MGKMPNHRQISLTPNPPIFETSLLYNLWPPSPVRQREKFIDFEPYSKETSCGNAQEKKACQHRRIFLTSSNALHV
jgi:hypothetical protein